MPTQHEFRFQCLAWAGQWLVDLVISEAGGQVVGRDSNRHRFGDVDERDCWGVKEQRARRAASEDVVVDK